MPYNKLRKDYLLNRWTVIATERARRPTDFAKKKIEPAETSICPLCPGNEIMTPPATLVYLEKNNEIQKTKETDRYRSKNWIIRSIPNMYPAFSPLQGSTNVVKLTKRRKIGDAIGHHEVLVESPKHKEQLTETPIKQLVNLVNAYKDRTADIMKEKYVQYVQIFRNYGLDAGASLSHPHSQIIATPFIPSILKEEQAASKKYYRKHCSCVFCDLINQESQTPRRIFDNDHFTVIAPYASVNPMEFWIIPKRHAQSILDLNQIETKVFAKTLKIMLKALKKVVNDPPYNFGFHQSLKVDEQEQYHWHLEVYPHLTIWAGFEKSTGVYINTITPETAAAELRNVIEKQSTFGSVD